MNFLRKTVWFVKCAVLLSIITSIVGCSFAVIGLSCYTKAVTAPLLTFVWVGGFLFSYLLSELQR